MRKVPAKVRLPAAFDLDRVPGSVNGTRGGGFSWLICRDRARGPVLSLESLVEAGPARVVIRLQRRSVERKASRADNEARLEHEGERVGDSVRLQIGGDRLLEGGAIGTVRRQAI